MLCIPYNSIELNNNAVGKIFRIYNKNNNKSYINYTNNNLFTISNIINELKAKKFYITDMQNDWNNNIANFFAEDLQLYYSINEISILMINWQNYFGGTNKELLYNIEEFKNHKNIDELLDENKYYIYYTTQLLKVNKNLQEQLNILNQNYINLQNYNINIKNDLTSINTLIAQQIKDSPIQILQMLTSLLTITSAECNIQFNKSIINSLSTNTTSTNNMINNENNSSQQKIIIANNNSLTNENIINESISNENKFISNENENNHKKMYNKNQSLVIQDTKITYNKINAAIQLIQQYIPILKRLIKVLRSNQFVNINSKDKVLNDINDIQNLFNRINAQIIIYKENIILLNNSSQFVNIMNKINKQLQNFKNDFNGLKNNIYNRIKQIELKNNSKINTDNLSIEELIKLKLQKSDNNIKTKVENTINNKSNNNIETKVENIIDNKSNNNNNNTNDDINNEKNDFKLFPLFDGKKPIAAWLRIAYQWLINNNYINFAQELQHEVNKSLINKSPTKALNYALTYNKGINYNDIAKLFNISKIKVMQSIDSLQATHPAIYLALGYKSKNSQGKNKRVIKTLHNLNITNIPSEL